MSVYIFHGPKHKRESDSRRYFFKFYFLVIFLSLANYDIVITTYQTVNSELSEKHKLNDYLDDKDDIDNSDLNSPFMKKTRKDILNKIVSF